MAIDFPDSPVVGQIFNLDVRSWEWNGVTWDSVSASSGGGGTGTGVTWVTATADYTALQNEVISADSSGGRFTITLPSSPILGGTISIVDSASKFSAYPVTVSAGTVPIMGRTVDLVLNVKDAFISLAYINSTVGWKVI
jgi:Ran-binding protein 9/10